MQGTYDAVVSAAGYLSTLPFVNSKKMGLQGHSFGGVQTNYLVTHTNLFAAAESSAGLADFVSFYGTLAGGTDSRQDFNENGQLRMGGSLWEKPEAYIKNSAIFQIEKVTTPILLMHTKSDDIANVMEFFTGLRRMGKKAWMLVYSEGNHGVWKKEAEDLSVRMMQFFDHYLKDKPAPLWMLDGVSAKDRSWDAGLKLDTNGRTPGQGLLTAEEQEKVNTMMTRKPITITLK
jgi:dipeptidyl aminopeptidase/acylaminoacyl peptidase